jgi:hypothetical protein
MTHFWVMQTSFCVTSVANPPLRSSTVLLLTPNPRISFQMPNKSQYIAQVEKMHKVEYFAALIDGRTQLSHKQNFSLVFFPEGLISNPQFWPLSS